MSLKKTSSVVTISVDAIETGANTFTQTEHDLQLSALDNEVFVVLAIDASPAPPDGLAGVDTATSVSISTTSRTAVGNIGDNNVLGAAESLIRAAGFVDSGVGFQQLATEAPTAMLDFIGIISTNNFFTQIEGLGNAGAKSAGVRLWGYRARADAATYAALVQSEVLSA
jgi:hypothetical protein